MRPVVRRVESLARPGEPTTDRYLNVPRDGTIAGAATQRPARDLRPIHGTGRITKYGVCIVTFTGSPRITSMGADWFNRAFDDAAGIVTFFRTATGGRHDIEWQVFGPIDLMTLADKVALDTGPENRRQRTVDAF